MNSVLILGASSDIAASIAYVFAKHQFKIVLAARNTSRIQHLASDINLRHDVPVDTIKFDALEYNSHQKLFDELPEKPLVTVCAFGYLEEQKIAEQDWTKAKFLIDTNYTGAVSILNIVAAYYENIKSGTIIGISSVAGERGRQSNYIYGSAKAGFTVYLQGLRNRLYKSKVHVVTVKPGFVDTKMTEHLELPKLLTAKPDQVAIAIFKAFKSKKNIIYSLSIWRYIMLVIKLIPEKTFKKLKF